MTDRDRDIIGGAVVTEKFIVEPGHQAEAVGGTDPQLSPDTDRRNPDPGPAVGLAPDHILPGRVLVDHRAGGRSGIEIVRTDGPAHPEIDRGDKLEIRQRGNRDRCNQEAQFAKCRLQVGRKRPPLRDHHILVFLPLKLDIVGDADVVIPDGGGIGRGVVIETPQAEGEILPSLLHPEPESGLLPV